MLTAKQLPEAIRMSMSIDVTCIVLGPPGCGKTAVIEQVAEEDNLLLIPKSLGQTEPGDLLGYAKVNEALGKFQYIPSELIPLETDEVPEGKDGWLLFLDELPNALPAVQIAAYKLIQERRVGHHKVHPKCRIVAAGNRDEDGCYTYTMPMALRSKMMILHFSPETDVWLEYGYERGLDYRVLAYISAYRERLNTSSEDSLELSYGCGRTWERVSTLIKGKEDLSGPVLFNCISGLVSLPLASHFLAFVKYFEDLPKYEDIIAEPETTFVSSDSDIGLQWATIGMLLNNLKVTDKDILEKELPAIVTYLGRGPKEYLLAFLQMLANLNPQAVFHPSIRPYIKEFSDIIKK